MNLNYILYFQQMQLFEKWFRVCNFIAERGKYRLSLFITPSVRDILLAIFFVCVSSSSCIHLLLILGN